jgi:hemolysin D
VVTLSHDAVSLEHEGLAYAARVSLKRTRIQVDGTQVPLSLGMAVTVEIKTSTRRLLEYLLSLVLQAGQESV